jgi:alcohol dehydrogenase
MKALVYHGPDRRSWDTIEDPTIIDPTDVVVRIDTSTICGSDLHILKGHVPETTPRFALGDTMAAYDTFADAANTGALKVVLDGSENASDTMSASGERVLAGAGV